MTDLTPRTLCDLLSDQDKKFSSFHYRLLFCLVSLANEKKEIAVTFSYLARKSQIPETNLQTALNLLIKKNLILSYRKARIGLVYKINFEIDWLLKPH